MKNKEIILLFTRYLILVLAGVGNLFLFYKIFTFPTIQISYFILSLFRETTLIGNYVIFGNIPFQIIGACIAGAAYYFLFILSMSVPLEKLKRIKLILFLFGSFFLINILRIVIMAFLLETALFEIVHLVVWNFLSTILVVALWFLSVKIFRIKSIPFYTDFLLIKNLKNSDGKSKNNKSRSKNSKRNR